MSTQKQSDEDAAKEEPDRTPPDPIHPDVNALLETSTSFEE